MNIHQQSGRDLSHPAVREKNALVTRKEDKEHF